MVNSNFFRNEEINQKIKTDLKSGLSEIKDHKFGYFIINKRNLNEICIINNHPEWFELYIKFSHQMVDPVVVKSLSRIEDFHWDEDIVISSRLALPKVMLHAKEYNITSGHTFVLHDYRNNLVLLSIFNTPEEKPKEELLLNRKELFLLLAKTHQKILSMYEHAEGNTRGSIIITKRENEIIYWSSKGKTYKEVAIITGVQVATVKFHMRNIVSKLGAINTKHAINLASDLKLIRPPSDSQR